MKKFYGHSPPFADLRRVVVSYKRKYVHKVLSQACPGKNDVSCTDRLNITIPVDWDVKPRIISVVKHICWGCSKELSQ